MLSENEFWTLFYCKCGFLPSEYEISDEIKQQIEKKGEIYQHCTAENWITPEGKVTDSGEQQLLPYKVDNAVIMAAGMSSRFAPLSYEKPKGMLVVKGEILIERQIRQLHEAGIHDITIVLGYMKEQFFYLEEKYGVKLVINEDYYKYNNPSSLMLVLDKLQNTYICSSDNYFTENVFEPYCYHAYYSTERAGENTDEYCVETDSENVINRVTAGGVSGSWYMIGHAYFDHDFSKRFSEILRTAYLTRPASREKLWEDLYAENIQDLKLYIRKYHSGVIYEFDSLDELRFFDKNYINNADSEILKNICKVLKCDQKDIQEIVAIKKGLTNASFKFECKGKKYVYRHPGTGTDEYISRKSEEFSMKVAQRLDLDGTYIFMDPQKGWKISHYVENARNLDYHNRTEVKEALAMIKKLHDANIKSEYDFDIQNAALAFVDKIAERGRSSFADFEDILQMMNKIFGYVNHDNVEKRLCHCDCYDPNFLVDEAGKLYLIDWEYSGNDDPANDLGTFICCSDYNYEEAMEVLDLYFGEQVSDSVRRHFIAYVAIAAFYWFVWAIFQESIGNNVGEYLYIWYKDTLMYGKQALKMYEK